MANEEHLAILKQGVEAWNRWREEHPEIIPDLHKADLTEMNLRGVNLRDVVLTEANLRGADLREADLHFAILGETILSDTDLTDAKNLDSCTHHRPSTLDHRTIVKSKKLPLIFLRSCGLPDALIDYFPLLLEPVHFYSCFISYSSHDEDFARRIHADLQNSGVRSWFAPEDMRIGDRFRERIDESIRMYDKLLLIFSENTVGSAWVKTEVEKALEREKWQKLTVLFPIRLDDTIMQVKASWAEDLRRTRHIGDFRRWRDEDSYRRALSRLLRDLTLTVASEATEKERA
jgi:hypothetical protein